MYLIQTVLCYWSNPHLVYTGEVKQHYAEQVRSTSGAICSFGEELDFVQFLPVFIKLTVPE